MDFAWAACKGLLDKIKNDLSEYTDHPVVLEDNTSDIFKKDPGYKMLSLSVDWERDKKGTPTRFMVLGIKTHLYEAGKPKRKMMDFWAFDPTSHDIWGPRMEEFKKAYGIEFNEREPDDYFYEGFKDQ